MESLQQEIKTTKNIGLKRVCKYLLERFETDSTLAKTFEERNITTTGIWEYIESQAKKKAVDGCACIEDEEVYNWAVHYILDEPITKAEKSHLVPVHTEESPKPVQQVQRKSKKEKVKEINVEKSSLFDFM